MGKARLWRPQRQHLTPRPRQLRLSGSLFCLTCTPGRRRAGQPPCPRAICSGQTRGLPRAAPASGSCCHLGMGWRVSPRRELAAGLGPARLGSALGTPSAAPRPAPPRPQALQGDRGAGGDADKNKRRKEARARTAGGPEAGTRRGKQEWRSDRKRRPAKAVCALPARRARVRTLVAAAARVSTRRLTSCTAARGFALHTQRSRVLGWGRTTPFQQLHRRSGRRTRAELTLRIVFWCKQRFLLQTTMGR